MLDVCMVVAAGLLAWPCDLCTGGAPLTNPASAPFHHLCQFHC